MSNTPRLDMHPRIPRSLPTWAQMLESLNHPTPARVAKWLGVSERTVWNYNARGQAPRAAMLALFWLTPWGDSALDCDRENLVRVLQSLTNAQGHQLSGLRTRIAYLEAIGGFGSANEPVAVPEMTPPRRSAL